MADGIYKLECNFKTVDFVRGSIIDARKEAVRYIKSLHSIGCGGIVVYIYRNRKLLGLVRDWYHGQFQWAAYGSKTAYIVGMDGRVRNKVKE